MGRQRVLMQAVAVSILILCAALFGCTRAKSTEVSGEGANAPSAAPEADEPDRHIVAEFGPEDAGKEIPPGWREQTFDPDDFPKKSEYKVIKLEDKYVLRARTDGGVSGLYKPVNVKIKDFPYIAWKWRVEQVFEKTDARTKEGDDYPARLYIAFKYDPERVGFFTRATFELAKRRSEEGEYPPLWALNYVWANKLTENTWIPNPWQERSKMIAVQSGSQGTGKWRWEVRNYLKDFKAIVGEEPTPIQFIAVMIDGDGTGSRGVSYFERVELWSDIPPYAESDRLPPPREYEASR